MGADEKLVSGKLLIVSSTKCKLQNIKKPNELNKIKKLTRGEISCLCSN
jgi:hypothetical protein